MKYWQEQRHLASKERDIINLGIGQPDFRTPNHIVEAAIKALRDGHHGYTPAPGILPLREAVAKELFNSRGVEVNPNHLVCVPGGKVTMFFYYINVWRTRSRDYVSKSRLSNL